MCFCIYIYLHGHSVSLAAWAISLLHVNIINLWCGVRWLAKLTKKWEVIGLNLHRDGFALHTFALRSSENFIFSHLMKGGFLNNSCKLDWKSIKLKDGLSSGGRASHPLRTFGGSIPSCSSLHARVSLGKILNPRLLSDAFIRVWMCVNGRLKALKCREIFVHIFCMNEALRGLP